MSGWRRMTHISLGTISIRHITELPTWGAGGGGQAMMGRDLAGSSLGLRK